MALEEQIVLDIQDALNSVGQLETALTSAASLFASSLAEALTVLDSLQIGTVDASAVTADIDAAVAAADLAPVVTADASSVTDDIDSAVAAVDAQVTPTTDAEGITADIDAAVAAADATVTPSVDTSSVVDDIDSAVAAAEPVITPTVDTTGAVSEIDNLSSSASGATGSVSGLGGATEGFAAAAALGRGEVQGLADGVGGISAGAAPAVAGIAALGATTAFLFNAAADSAQAEEMFARSLGSVADEVKKVDIGGLNEDLQALAQRTGNDDEALLRASAHIAELGKSAGATQPQIAETAKQIDVLAIRATTLDPALGQAGDVADRMTAAFARGGRALVPFHIALTTADINARALADTGKAAAADLTIFEKAAAGAALTTEQLGNKLGTDINEGAKSAQVQIRSLKEEFQNAIEELGKPLLDPVVRSLKEAVPAVVAIAADFAHLAQAVLPLFAKGIEAIAPLVGGASVAFGLLVDVLGPIVDLIVKIPTPILTAVAAFAALGPVLTGIGSLLVTTFFAVGKLEGALISLAANPLGLAAIAVGVLATFFLQQRQEADKARAANQAYADELGDLSKSLDQIIDKKVEDDFKSQSDELNKLGITVKDLAREAKAGKAGYSEFLDSLVKGGAISASTAEFLEKLGVNSHKFTLAASIGIEGLNAAEGKLVATQIRETAAAEAAAKAKLSQYQAEGTLTGAVINQAEAQHRLAGGAIDYVGVLRQLRPAQEAEEQGHKEAGQSAKEHAADLKGVTDALNKLIDAELASVDKGLAAEQAQRHIAEAGRALVAAELAARDATAQHGASSEEAAIANDKLKQAEDDVIGSATSLAQKNIDAANATAALSGHTVTAAEKQHIIDAAFNQVASTLAEGSPLRTRLEGLKTASDRAAGNYKLEFAAETAGAQAAIDALNSQIKALTSTPHAVVIDGQFLGVSGRMAGGPVSAGEAVVVGEREPELFVPNVSGFVLNQRQIADIVRSVTPATVVGADGGQAPVVTQHVTVNEVAHDPRATAFAVSSRIAQGARR